jgi:hypothetical protein
MNAKTNVAMRKALGMIKEHEWETLGAETKMIKLV